MRRIGIFLATVALIAGTVGGVGGVSGSGAEYCTLTINSTAGGVVDVNNVTVPGNAIFTYELGAVVSLNATPDTGCQFASWTGNVSTVGNVTAASTTINMSGNYSIIANFECVEYGNVGIKVGDWIRLKYEYHGWPADQPYPEWLKLEVLSVEGTNSTVRFTQHNSDGTEESDNATVNIVANIEVPVLAGIVISANRTIGDYVYIAEYGLATIEEEAERIYAGASRTVLGASFSYNNGQITYYWDRLTGVMVELSAIYSDFAATAKAVGTNMWEATTVRMPWWLWIIVAVAVAGLVTFFVRRRRVAKRKR
jgi:Divergent InlB B-repeat domain